MDVAIYNAFPSKVTELCSLMLKSIHWTPMIFLMFIKDSPGGVLGREKSKQTLKLMISLLLECPQGAHGGLQIWRNPYNSIF